MELRARWGWCSGRGMVWPTSLVCVTVLIKVLVFLVPFWEVHFGVSCTEVLGIRVLVLWPF